MSTVIETRKPARLSELPAGRIFAWLFLGLMILLTLFPVWWVLRTALTAPRSVYTNPADLFPVGMTLDNFLRVLGLMDVSQAIAAGGSGMKLNFMHYLRNSFIYTGLLLAGQVFFSSLAAYAFARLQFWGRDKLFLAYLTALMVPGVVTLIPNYVTVRSLGWINTFPGMVAPGFLFSPFAVFFLRQFFLSLSRDIEEAAKIDGAGTWTIFWRIALPMSLPAVATLTILSFFGAWNDYLWPLLTGSNEKVRVLTVALAIFRSQTPQGSPDWAGLMAANFLTMLPTLAVFIALGRKVVNSLQFSGFR